MNSVNLRYVILGIACDYAEFLWQNSVTMETRTLEDIPLDDNEENDGINDGNISIEQVLVSKNSLKFKVR